MTGCVPKKRSEIPSLSEPTISPTPTKPLEEAIQERPYVSLLPSADGHWVTLEVRKIKMGTISLEYELIYFAEVEGSRIERGVSTGGKPIELSSSNEFSKKILFGSASCTTGTCKYKYDENVNEGTLSLKLNGKFGTERYETVFRIQKGKEAREGLTTGDGLFTFTSQSLPVNNLYLCFSSLGLPSLLPEKVMAKSEPYSILPLPSGQGTVSFKTAEEGVKIYLWDKQKWQELETTVSGGLATTQTAKAGIFILGK